MYHKIIKILLLSICLFFTIHSVAEPFHWGDNYQPFYADFNNDGTIDLLLQADSERDNHYLVLGSLVDNKVAYLSESSRVLPQQISEYSWSQQSAYLLVGDFNADNIDDIFLVQREKPQAFTFLGHENGIDFSTQPDFSYTDVNFSWLKYSKDYDAYLGDFHM